jgi:hypothetical protein
VGACKWKIEKEKPMIQLMVCVHSAMLRILFDHRHFVGRWCQRGMMIWAGLIIGSYDGRQAQAGTTTLVLSGQPVPGGGGSFGSPSIVSLNDFGQVAFVDTSLMGTGSTGNDTGIFRAGGQGGTLKLVREGQSAPGGGTIGPLSDYPPLNNAGQAVAALRVSGGSGDEAIFRFNGGTLDPVVREGDGAPGGGTFGASAGLTFSSAFTSPVINPSGQTAFIASVLGSGTPNDLGVFRADPGDIIFPAKIARIAGLGDREPEGSSVFAGFRDVSLGSGTPFVGGYVTFVADLTPPGQSTTERGIFRGTPDGVVEIARQGASAGGAGTFGSILSDPTMNDLGQVAFIGSVAGAGSDQRRGIFRASEYSTAAIALAGDPAPGGNGVFGGFTSPPAINTAGQVAFVAPIVSTLGGSGDDSGVYLGNGGALVNVAREGQAAPGGGHFSGFGSLALNIAGNLAFAASVRSATNIESTGLFYYGATSGLRQIAREGDPLEGSTIAGDLTFAPSTGTNGIWRSGMNNNNQLAFPFTLADGRSGIAVWTPDVTLPVVTGDYNNNRRVEQGDLDLVLLNWGKAANPLPANWRGDPPVGTIDQQELDKALLNWGFIRGAMSIPEPSGMTLAAACVLVGIVLSLKRHVAHRLQLCRSHGESSSPAPRMPQADQERHQADDRSSQ